MGVRGAGRRNIPNARAISYFSPTPTFARTLSRPESECLRFQPTVGFSISGLFALYKEKIRSFPASELEREILLSA